MKHLALQLVVILGVGSVVLVLLGALQLLSSALTLLHPPTPTLLHSEGWGLCAGATTTPQGLRIEPLRRVITHQDGSQGQPNPPVCLIGPHLSVSGDFVITARMDDINDRGTVRLYAAPPIVFDQWRFETGSVSVEVATTSITVRIWDGSAGSAVDMRSYPYLLQKSTSISIEHRGSIFTINVDGHILGSIPDHSILDTGEVWLGFDAGEDDEWTLSALDAHAIGAGHLEVLPPISFEVPEDKKQTLRTLAANQPHKIYIGAAVSYGPLVTDEGYRTTALTDFSMITPENGMKPQFIHPSPDVYSFTEMDALIHIAQIHDVLIHGHALVYAKSNPQWMNDAPPESLEEIMTEHVTEVVSHFKGEVTEWDVVNEPLSNKKAPYHDGRRGLDDTLWYSAMGEEYIDKAFRAAHDADPSAKLYLNDYGLERDGERWDALLSLVRRLQSRGVPIDGVGFEAHIYGDGDYINAAVLRAHMRTLASLGLLVRISEIDVTGDDPQEQINQYVLALDTCLRSPNCTAYSTWGITDRYGSTTRSDRYPLVFGTSLLWDTQMKPKPAYQELQKRLGL